MILTLFEQENRDEIFQDCMHALTIFVFCFKFKGNYEYYGNLLRQSGNEGLIQGLLKSFNDSCLQVLLDGQFFEENLHYLLYLANMIENMSDFQADILNEKFLSSMLYYVENNKSTKTAGVIA